MSATSTARAPGQQRTISRRTVVKGAAWAVPVVAVGASAAHAGPSQCLVNELIRIQPQSEWTLQPVPAGYYQTTGNENSFVSLDAEYGWAYAPSWLEICNCQVGAQCMRWQETDTRFNYQILVDGVQVSDVSGDGWRPPVLLPAFGDEGACYRVNLSYRTTRQCVTGGWSGMLHYATSQNDSNADSVSITFRLLLRPYSGSGDCPTRGWDLNGPYDFTVTVCTKAWRRKLSPVWPSNPGSMCSGSTEPGDSPDCTLAVVAQSLRSAPSTAEGVDESAENVDPTTLEGYGTEAPVEARVID